MFKSSMTLAIAAAAAAATAVPAYAAENEVRVEYSDLDLTSEAGQKALDKRLDKAARQVCGLGEARTGTRMESTTSRKCYRDARKQLEQQFADVVSNSMRGG